jgi:hypothetical protein
VLQKYNTSKKKHKQTNFLLALQKYNTRGVYKIFSLDKKIWRKPQTFVKLLSNFCQAFKNGVMSNHRPESVSTCL